MILPIIPVVVPLLAAALLATLHRVVPRRVAFYISWLAAGASIYAGTRLLLDSFAGRIVYWFGNWQPHGGIALGICFAIDPLGAGLATLAGVLVLMALLVSSRYFDTVGCLFHVLILTFLAAMCGFALTGDLFNLFVFFELMSAAAFALCGYKSEEPGPLEGALNFAVVNTTGAFLVLIGIALVYGRTGALNMAQAGATLGTRSDGLIVTAFVFIAAGYFTKAAIVPFHFWLADAHTVAPTPVCILFSGVMVEMGLYAVARVYWTIFQGPFSAHDSGFRIIIVGLGTLTAVTGSIMCFAQRNIKRLLAFSTIGHMGLMLIGFGLLNARALQGLAVYLAGHGLIKGALFVYAGILLHRFGTVDEFQLHGRGKSMPVTGALFVVGGLLLAGAPPGGLFRGSDLIQAGARDAGYRWIAAIDLLVGVLTGGAVLRVAAGVFGGWGPRRERSGAGGRQIEEKRETHGGAQKTPAVMSVPACLMLAGGAAWGASAGLSRAVSYGAAMFESTNAYRAAVLGGQMPRTAAMPAHEPDILIALISSAGAILLALYTVFGARRRREPLLSRGLDGLAAPLRRLHSGIVCDYVAWFTLGVAALGAASAVFLR